MLKNGPMVITFVHCIIFMIFWGITFGILSCIKYIIIWLCVCYRESIIGIHGTNCRATFFEPATVVEHPVIRFSWNFHCGHKNGHSRQLQNNSNLPFEIRFWLCLQKPRRRIFSTPKSPTISSALFPIVIRSLQCALINTKCLQLALSVIFRPKLIIFSLKEAPV